MSILDAYDEEFKTLCQKISKDTSALRDSVGGNEDSTALVSDIESHLEQAKDVLKQMEVVVGTEDPSTSEALAEKMTVHENTLLHHRSNFERFVITAIHP